MTDNMIQIRSCTEIKQTLLIVDDDPAMLRALSLLLQQHADIVAVPSVQQALDLLQNNTFDVVITDYEIGDGNGLDVLDYVNSHQPHVPVIIITAYGTKDRAIQTINHQVFGFVEKPFEPDHVEAMIKRALLKKEHEEIIEAFAGLGESAGHLVHEIASPLMVLYGMIDGLKDDAKEANSERLMSSADTMANAAKRIGAIIKWARTSLKTTKDVKHEVFQMREVLDRLKEECSAKAASYKVPVVITPASDVKVVGDKQQILQVLVNLVNNAIDAAAAEEEKWVMVDLKSVDGKAQMSVTDSGKGIPEDIREKLFTPLFSTKREAGTGLGLAIVQKIVKAHGGEIFLQDKATNTQFVVNLPKAA